DGVGGVICWVMGASRKAILPIFLMNVKKYCLNPFIRKSENARVFAFIWIRKVGGLGCAMKIGSSFRE
ncbi:hypothetical protein, partial [Deinococcus saxicola]|uniref:hypothetical protein n=1 Tax=Deinococcus saxicola TaxID=249406 RepID=UPI0039EE3C76